MPPFNLYITKTSIILVLFHNNEYVYLQAGRNNTARKEKRNTQTHTK